METNAANSFTHDYLELRRLFIKGATSVNVDAFKRWIKLRGAITVEEASVEVKHLVKEKLKDKRYRKLVKRQSWFEKNDLATAGRVKDE